MIIVIVTSGRLPCQKPPRSSSYLCQLHSYLCLLAHHCSQRHEQGSSTAEAAPSPPMCCRGSMPDGRCCGVWGRQVSEDVLDLLSRMVAFDPARRITAAQALQHRYFASHPPPTPPARLPRPALRHPAPGVAVTPLACCGDTPGLLVIPTASHST